jgi:hypothetical protein
MSWESFDLPNSNPETEETNRKFNRITIENC